MDHLGGCACGRLRFRATDDPVETGYCHCRLCQRTTGAPVLAWASFPVAAFAYTTGSPSRFASSALGSREFCGHCGTQIAFRKRPATVTVDVNVGALDDPALYPPAKHIWCARDPVACDRGWASAPSAGRGDGRGRLIRPHGRLDDGPRSVSLAGGERAEGLPR